MHQLIPCPSSSPPLSCCRPAAPGLDPCSTLFSLPPFSLCPAIGSPCCSQPPPCSELPRAQKLSVAFKAIKALGDLAPFSAMQCLDQQPACASCTPRVSPRAPFAPSTYFLLILHIELRCHLFQEAFLDTTPLPGWVKDLSSGVPCV